MIRCDAHHHTIPAYEARARLTVAEISKNPRALEVLKDAGINHCCGAHLPLAEAAAAAGVALTPLLARLEAVDPAVPWAAETRPDELRRFDAAHQTVLDVRDDLGRGQEPFGRIMTALSGLPRDAALLLRTPFEPLPLYQVLGGRGFRHWAERRAADDWVVWCWQATPTPATSTIDVRGLEPPEPMVRVLARLDTLGAGEALAVVHDRHPIFLYPQLDARGFAYETAEDDGVVRISIRRAERTG